MVLFVVVDGIIGSGKSTVLQALKKKGYIVEPQPVEKWTLLESYYENPEKYCLPLQKQIIDSYNDIILKYDDDYSKTIVFLESCSLISIRTFGRMVLKLGLIEKNELEYLKLLIRRFLISLYIHLEVLTEIAFDRIKLRKYNGETNITNDYLVLLKGEYDEILIDQSNTFNMFKINNNKDDDVDHIISSILKRINVGNKFDIAIEGNIGSGKTTLGTLLSKKCDFVEQVLTDKLNELLAKKESSACKRQEEFINMYKIESMKADEKKIVCWEGILSVLHVFTEIDHSNGKISTVDRNGLELMYYQKELPHISDFKLIILLLPPLDVLKKRIKERGRGFEKDIPEEYLKKISKAYNKMARKYENVYVVDNSTSSNEEIVDMIHTQWQRNYFNV